MSNDSSATPEKSDGASSLSVLSAETSTELPSKRRRKRRSSTVSVQRVSKRERARIEEERAKRTREDADDGRPMTYGDCQDLRLATEGNRCPYLSCVWHLGIDVSRRTGAIRLNFASKDGRGVDLEAMSETCTLRTTERGGLTLEEVGVIMGVTKERVRQIEADGLAAISKLVDLVRAVDKETDETESSTRDAQAIHAMEAILLSSDNVLDSMVPRRVPRNEIESEIDHSIGLDPGE